MVKFLFKVKLVCFILCFAQFGEAKVKLPALISNGMVLQREQNIRVWGTADPGESVTVDFRKKKYTTQAGADGNWTIALPPAKAGGPYTMTVNDLEIKNILIGDVYLCSGQSNMELPVYRVMDMFQSEVEAYSNPMIRHVKVPLNYNFHGPLPDIKPADWKELNPQDAMQFSALGYFFAKTMYEKNKIPVGLINSAVGGSPVEAWISEEGLKPFPKYLNERDLYQSDDYVATVRNTDQTKSIRWSATLYKNDPGLHEPVKWFDAAYNDSDWKTVDLFDNWWNNNGLNPVNGSHWFRKEIDVTASQAGELATLRLGCIVDADSVYVNGTFVGAISYQYPPRIYQLPEGLLKAGKNTVTVRMISYGGRPRFVPGKPYKIITGRNEISLEGRWKYKQGAPMPAAAGGTTFQYIPTGLYNAMIAPLIGCNFKGVIWYQGESNTGRYNEYYDLLKALIADWRTSLNASFPFVIVQLPDFMEAGNEPAESNWAELRNVQLKLSQHLHNVGLSVNIDLGEWNDIHPLNKKDVAHRIALQMLKLAHNNREITADGPVYETMKREGNTILLSFKEGTNDLMPVDELKGFAIAGPDRKYRWAKAVILAPNIIKVWSDEIPNPVSVRYAWADNPEGANLKNREGLPASPFQAGQMENETTIK